MRATSIAIGWAAATSLLLTSCGEPEIEFTPAAPGPGAAPEASIRGDTSDLGAARYVPADASYFSSVHGLGKLFEDLKASSAAQEILRLPTVGMGLMMLNQSEPLLQLQAMAKADPMLQAVVDLAMESFKDEAFVYGGADWVPFMAAAREVYMTAMLAELRNNIASEFSPEAKARGLIKATLQHKKALHMPPLTFGFRVSSAASTKKLLADLIARARRAMPFPIELTEVGDASYFSLRIIPDMVPFWRMQLAAELDALGAANLKKEFMSFVASQSLTLAVGMHGDYLLFSIGSSHEHLQRFGQIDSLAQSKQFAPLRKHLGPNLLSLAYLSEDMRMGGKLPVDRLMAGLDELLPAMPAGETRTSFEQRLRGDLRRLLNEINDNLPEPTPFLSASFLNRGIEAFTFGLQPRSSDSDEPLEILNHAGSRPLVVLAARPPRSTHAYDRLVHWLRVGYGYFEDFAVPQMSSGDRESFDRFEQAFMPTFDELDQINRDLLLPSIDGSESLLSIDGRGELRERTLPDLRYPQPALVWELQDTDKFLAACRGYMQSINALFARVAEFDQNFDFASIPEPQSRKHAGGTMYFYPMPVDVPVGIQPHALISGDHLILSLSPDQSHSIVRDQTKLPSDTVNLGKPAGSATWVDIEGLVKMLGDDTAKILAFMVETGSMQRRDHLMAKIHSEALFKALRAMKSFSSRSFEEDGTQVVHSWLQVR